MWFYSFIYIIYNNPLILPFLFSLENVQHQKLYWWCFWKLCLISDCIRTSSVSLGKWILCKICVLFCWMASTSTWCGGSFLGSILRRDSKCLVIFFSLLTFKPQTQCRLRTEQTLKKKTVNQQLLMSVVIVGRKKKCKSNVFIEEDMQIRTAVKSL